MVEQIPSYDNREGAAQMVVNPNVHVRVDGGRASTIKICVIDPLVEFEATDLKDAPIFEETSDTITLETPDLSVCDSWIILGSGPGENPSWRSFVLAHQSLIELRRWLVWYSSNARAIDFEIIGGTRREHWNDKVGKPE